MSCGPIWAYDDKCVACERPEIIAWDQQSPPALHNETGPAVKFRDGTSLYCWHGFTIPAWIIEEPQKITPTIIDEERNQEIRRILIDRFGVDRYLTETGAKVVSMDEHTHNGVRAILKDKDNRQWLAVADPSTGRTYTLRAPDDAKTPEEADEALWGFKFNQVGRT